jgi:hypothetical protein
MCICLIRSIRGLPFTAQWQQYIPPALTVTGSAFSSHSVLIFVGILKTNGDYFLKQN